MSPTVKFIVFQALIVLPFAAGYVAKRRMRDPGTLAKRIVTANLVTIEPVVALWSIWGLALTPGLIVLPLSGVSTVLLGMALGCAALPLVRLSGRSRATFLITASLANHGYTMGGFICYLVLGEQGIGLSFIFISYFMLYLYLVIFHFARISGRTDNAPLPFLKFFVSRRNLPLYAIIAAIILQLAGIPRPAVAMPVEYLLMASVAAYYFSLGINFSFSDLRDILPETAAISVIKFALIPLIAIAACRVIPMDSAARTVIIIESCMPAAVYSVITAILFDLDSKLASGIFVLNTVIFILFILPAILIAASWR